MSLKILLESKWYTNHFSKQFVKQVIYKLQTNTEVRQGVRGLISQLCHSHSSWDLRLTLNVSVLQLPKLNGVRSKIKDKYYDIW